MKRKRFKSPGEQSADRIMKACIDLGVHEEAGRRRKPSVNEIYDYAERHGMNFQHLHRVIHGKKYVSPRPDDQEKS